MGEGQRARRPLLRRARREREGEGAHPDRRSTSSTPTLASYEQVKKFAVLPQDLTLESGELTPSLKLKRKVVEQKYKALLDGFYSGAIADA